MIDENELFSFLEYSLKIAEEEYPNLKCAEVYLTEDKYITIEIEENSIKNSEIGGDSGISIRTIDDRGSLGFALTNKLNKNSVKHMVQQALRMTRSGTEDPDFINLPSSYEKYPKLKGLANSNIESLQIEDCIKYAEQMIKICEKDDFAISQSANIAANISKTFILNTNGINISGKDNVFSISSNIIVKDKSTKESAFGYEWQSVRDINEIDGTKISEAALQDGKRNLNRIKIQSNKLPLILTPNGTISLILSPIASAVNAESFQYKRSFLVNKLNEEIGSSKLTIRDDALINGAVGSSIFDGEGVPGQNKQIIQEGIFSSLIHNSYTAGKEGVKSTGNAARSSYGSTPSIGINNLIMKPGEIDKNEMIEEINDGILLDYTGDSPNISTGDFSGLILHGNLIKDGEIVQSLNETMIAINLLDLFKQIESISRESKVYGSYQAPYVKVRDVQILGSAN